MGQFVKIMLNEVYSANLDEKLQMMHGFIKFFQSIDINGDGSMEWNELIQQIIDTVISESIKPMLDINNQPVEICEILAQNAAQKFDRYSRNTKHDVGKHKRKVFDVLYCEETGNGANRQRTEKIIHSEEGSDVFSIYSTDLKPLLKLTVPMKMENAKITGICFRDMSTEPINFGPIGTSSLFALTSTDCNIHVYTQINTRLEYWKAIQTEKIQDRIWCLQHSRQFVTSGMKDFKLRVWNFSPFVRNPLVGEPIKIHKGAITDLVEIRNPPCIITCSLDKTIKMYNLEKRMLIRSFSQHHTNGVKQLTYIPGFGGHLLSRGFEVYINVWNPENLYGDPFIGQLRGHKHPVVSMDDIKTQPYIVTMDSMSEIIIWDIRNMFQLQNISSRMTKEFQCHGIFCFTKHKFWLYGTRFFEFDKIQGDAEVKDELQLQEEMVPQNAFYNEFFNQICVLTGNQLKIFNAEDGKLSVLHQNLMKRPNDIPLAIDQDKRHRKIYVASSGGLIQVMNIQSGVTIKQVVEVPEEIDPKAKVRKGKQGRQDDSKKSDEQEGTFLTQLKEEQRRQRVNESQSKEIVDIQLVWEKEMVQLIYCDKKTIYIYDEMNLKSDLLRSLTGAHTNDNITKLRFNHHLSLIASGSDSGRVAVWDYEIGRLLAFCTGHNEQSEITAIEFLSPYPIMVTCATDGKLLLWTVRPVPFVNSYICVAAFNNMSFNSQIEEASPVQSISVLQGEMVGIERGFPLFHQQIPATTYRDYQTTLVLAMHEDKVTVDKKTGKKLGPMGLFDARVAILQEYSKKDAFFNTKTEYEYAELKKNPPYKVAQSKLMAKDYDFAVLTKSYRFYIYTGDDLGYIKIWDFTYLLESLGFGKVLSYVELKPTFIPVRKEAVDVSQYALKLQKQAEMSRTTMPEPKECNQLIIREVLAHKMPVKKINAHSQGGFISCSRDMNVQVWSIGLDLWGVLNQKTNKMDSLWKFPVKNARQKVDEELSQMQDLLEDVGLKNQVGTLVACKDFKDESYEEGIDYTLGKLNEKHKRLEQTTNEQLAAQKKRRDQQKEEWLKMMSGDHKYDDDPILIEKPFDRNQYKLEQLQQYINNLSQEEAKYMSADIGSSIVPRKDDGLPKKVGDKIDQLIQDSDKLLALEKKYRDNMDLKLISKPRRLARPKLTSKFSQLSLGTIGTQDSPTKKSILNVDESPSPEKRSLSKSPVKKSTINLPILSVDEQESEQFGKPSIATKSDKLSSQQPILEDDKESDQSESKKRRQKPIEELNLTANLAKKIKDIKKTQEANPDALERDRQQILKYKNMPSLRQALESIKSARQKVNESDTLLSGKQERKRNQNHFASVKTSRTNDRIHSILIDTYAVPSRPGYKFNNRLPRNESKITYEKSVDKFIKSRNDSNSVQDKPIFANSGSIFELEQNVTGRFPGQFASQMENRKRKRTLGIDISAANLLSSAQGEIILLDQQEEKIKTPLRGIGEKRFQRESDLTSLRLNPPEKNDSIRIFSQESFLDNTRDHSRNQSTEKQFLPSVNGRINASDKDTKGRKESSISHPYNEATTASRNINHTPDGSFLGLGTHGNSIQDSNKMLLHNNSNFQRYERSLSIEGEKQHSKFLPKDQSVQLLDVTFQVPDPQTARKMDSYQDSSFRGHQRFSQAPPAYAKLNSGPIMSKVRAIHTLEYMEPISQIMLANKSSKKAQSPTISATSFATEVPTKETHLDYFTARAKSYSIRKEKYLGNDSILKKVAREEAVNIQRQRERIAELKGNIRF